MVPTRAYCSTPAYTTCNSPLREAAIWHLYACLRRASYPLARPTTLSLSPSYPTDRPRCDTSPHQPSSYHSRSASWNYPQSAPVCRTQNQLRRTMDPALPPDSTDEPTTCIDHRDNPSSGCSSPAPGPTRIHDHQRPCSPIPGTTSHPERPSMQTGDGERKQAARHSVTAVLSSRMRTAWNPTTGHRRHFRILAPTRCSNRKGNPSPHRMRSARRPTWTCAYLCLYLPRLDTSWHSRPPSMQSSVGPHQSSQWEQQVWASGTPRAEQ